MNKKQAYEAYHIGRRARLLAETIDNATAIIRYITRCKREGVKSYRLDLYPEGPQHWARRGIHVTVPPNIAHEHVKALAVAMREAAKAELEGM